VIAGEFSKVMILLECNNAVRATPYQIART
jgi:hypothetical protein